MNEDETMQEQERRRGDQVLCAAGLLGRGGWEGWNSGETKLEGGQERAMEWDGEHASKQV